MEHLLSLNKSIVVAGLDTDYKCKAFKNTAELLAMADEIIKLKSYCNVCGKPAAHTFKKTSSDLQIELGENNLYESRCKEHWHIVV